MPLPSRAREERVDERVEVRRVRLWRSSGRRVGSAEPAPKAGRWDRDWDESC